MKISTMSHAEAFVTAAGSTFAGQIVAAPFSGVTIGPHHVAPPSARAAPEQLFAFGALGGYATYMVGWQHGAQEIANAAAAAYLARWPNPAPEAGE